MRHYGDRPPWEGDSRYGHWRLRQPDPRSWFEDESNYWQWYPPRPSLTQIMQRFYVTPLKKSLNEPMFTRLIESLEAKHPPMPEPRISMLTRLRMRLGLPVFK